MNNPFVQYLAGYGLEVPELDVASRFYGSFGLGVQQSGEVLELRTTQNSSPDIVIVKGGTQKRLHHLSFAVLEADMPRFFDHLTREGCAPVTPAFSAIRPGLWFQDPWGTWINLTPVAGEREEPVKDIVIPGRLDKHLWRELNRDIKPNRLGHLLIFTPDFDKAQAWFERTLGLMTSDRAIGKVAFMAGGRGIRDHHCFGLINGTHRGFQHSSFQVNSFDDIGFGALQMHKAGYTEGFGLGRHALASNLFFYVRDPWGSWVEYYADMDKISDAWVTKDWQELPYIWPAWAPEFWTNEMNANHEPR